MCDRSPGVRCSDYATSTLKITKKRLEKIQSEKAAYEEKYAESLANTENPSPRDTIRQNKYQRLVESEQAHQRVVDGAEFEYHSCPVGQAELQADLKKAVENADGALQEELEARIKAGEEYRARNRENLRDLEQIEQEQGPEAATEAGWQKYEEATEAETEAIVLGRQAQAELEAARAQAEEYQRAMEEYRRNNPNATEEQLREEARKRKHQLLLIGALAATVLTMSLIRQAASGERSQLLQYGKSMMMRHAITHGTKYIAPLMKDGRKEAEERAQYAQQEAEERAAAAREKVLRKHEHDLAEEERKQLREQARREELEFRNTLREQEREAEREKRREEIAHFEELAAKFKDLPLTPEMQALIDSKRPQGRPRPNYNKGNQNVTGANSSRQYSNRKQGQPHFGNTQQPQPAATPA